MSFLVQIKNADVYVGGNKVLKSLSWTMGEKENWVVIGNNGTGKTTFMKLIFGELIPVYGGEVRWFGNRERTPLSEVREKIGYVSAEYQNSYDRPALGWEVVASGHFSSIGLHEQVTPKQKEAAFDSMRYLGIEYLSQTPYSQMSYGEARRVLLARSMVHSTRLMILDEPCTGLDIPTRETFLDTVQKMSRKRTRMIYVTHRIEEIMPCFTHVLYLKDGKVFKQGRKEAMLNSTTLSSALGCSLTVQENSGRYFHSAWGQ
ncbi:MAG: ATP-binding cassette domain-containing protein [Nitrospina sp.]|nr:ATP-binding cassette domain-containing protein [Nitrospina sp.]